MSTEYEKLLIRIETDVAPYLRGMKRVAKENEGLAADVEKTGKKTDEATKRGARGFDDLSKSAKAARAEIAKKALLSVGVDQKSLSSATKAIRKATGNLSGKATLKVEEDGAARTYAALERVDEKADSLDGRKVTLAVGALGAVAAGAALASVGKNADLLSSTTEKLARQKLPAMMAALGAAPAVISAVTVPTLALGQALGAGAAGFALIGGAAAGAGAGGLAAYAGAATAAVKGALDVRENMLSSAEAVATADDAVRSAKDALREATPGTRAYADAQRDLALASEAAADAQTELSRLETLNTPAARAFNKELDKQTVALTNVQAELGRRVLPSFTRMMALGRESLPTLTPPLYEMASATSNVAENFATMQLSGERLERTGRILSFIGDSGAGAALAIARLADGSLVIADRLIPAADRLNKKTVDLADSFRDWANSAEGTRQIGDTVERLESRMYSLLGIVRDTGRGIGGFFSALSESGVGDEMLTDVEGLASGFSHVGEKGSESREKIMAFADATLPVFEAGASLIGEMATEGGELAASILAFTEEGKKTSVLVETLEAVKDEIGPLAGMLEDTFKGIGPELPELVENMGGLAETFAGTTPVLETYLGLMNDTLGVFNDLPDPVKDAVANVAAWNLIVQGGGGPSLWDFVAGVAGVANSFLLLSRVKGVSAKLDDFTKAVQEASGTKLDPLQPTLATGPEVVDRESRKLSKFKRLVLGAAGAAVVITVVLTYDYEGAQSQYEKARENGQGMALATYNGFLEGLKGVPLVGPLITWLDESFDEAVGKKGRFDEALSPVGEGIMQGVLNGAKAFPIVGPLMGAVLEDIYEWWGIGEGKETASPKMSPLGSSIMLGILSGITGVPIAPALEVFNQLWGAMNPPEDRPKGTLDNVLASLGASLSMVPNVGPLVETAAVLWGALREPDGEGKKSLGDKLSELRRELESVPAVDGMLTAIGQLEIGFMGFGISVEDVWRTLKNPPDLSSVPTRIGEMKDQSLAHLTQMKDDAIARGSEMAAGVIERSLGMKEGTISNFLSQKTEGVSLSEQLQTGAMEAFGKIRDGVGPLFGEVRDRIVNPISEAYSGVVDWLDRIITAVNSVLTRVGLDPIGSVDRGGGTTGTRPGTTPTSGSPTAFATGGVVGTSAFASGGTSGGMGTNGKQPRTHLWNEQMGPEAYIVRDRPTSEQLPYLREAAGWHGYELSERGAGKNRIPSDYRDFASGGVEVAPVRAPVVPFAGGGIGAMYEQVKEKFGVEGFNNHGSYLSEPAASNSLDFMVTTPGNVAQGSEKALGDDIAAFVAPPSTVTTIWYGQANYGSGWQPYSTGPGVGNANTLAHMDHVHAQAYPDSFRGGTGTFTPGSGGGGGITGPNPKQIAFEQTWKRLVEPLVDRFLNPLESASYLPVQATGKAARKVPEDIYKWIDDKIEDTITIGGSPGGPGTDFTGGGSAAENRALGEKMLAASSVAGSFSSLDSLWTKESGWNERADNPSSDAYGIPQALPGSKMASSGSDWQTNPATQIDWGLGYIAERYGSTDAAWQHSQQNNWYRKGGIIPGAPGEAVFLPAHAGERILPRDTVQAFDRLASSVRLWSAKASGSGSGASGADIGIDPGGSDELVEALRRVERKLSDVGLSREARRAIEGGARRVAGEEMFSETGRRASETHTRNAGRSFALRGGSA